MPPRFVVEFGRDSPPPLDDGRLEAPTFQRNGAPIRDALVRALGSYTGHVVEIGSGTGQHIVDFARALPKLTWWPSDPNPVHRRSIEAWRRSSGLANLMAPVDLDAARTDWPLGQPGFPPDQRLSAIVCINVLHIAPWSVAQGLVSGAARRLAPDGRLLLYGPYKVNGAHTAPSNAEFDASLRARDPQWGVRDTGDVAKLAAEHGLAIVETLAMPANNLMLVVGFDRKR